MKRNNNEISSAEGSSLGLISTKRIDVKCMLLLRYFISLARYKSYLQQSQQSVYLEKKNDASFNSPSNKHNINEMVRVLRVVIEKRENPLSRIR